MFSVSGREPGTKSFRARFLARISAVGLHLGQFRELEKREPPYMETYTDRAQEIEHPKCAVCRSPMSLARIEPYDGDHDQRTFECKVCDTSKIEIVKFR